MKFIDAYLLFKITGHFNNSLQFHKLFPRAAFVQGIELGTKVPIINVIILQGF